ncbi:prepilin-type N-terminal cleavage/methylation domain-containing protein, partial [Patescibacteria group bacterium]|nr:prepilin-type N-terminal cleavage/methylation domain-containing protein [Patescibacteria group bacterium]
MKNQSGQSLIELLIALGVFVLVVTAINFLSLDTYVADRAGGERTQATFLAKEGIEAAISISDNNW